MKPATDPVAAIPARADRSSTLLLIVFISPFVLLIAWFVYASLPTPADKAEQQLAIVKSSSGSKAEICAASRQVADEWLRQLNKEKYRMAKIEADIACLGADEDRFQP